MGPSIHMTLPCRPTHKPAHTSGHTHRTAARAHTAVVQLSYATSRVARPRSSARPQSATSNTAWDRASHGRNNSAQDRRQTPTATHTKATKASIMEGTVRAHTHMHITTRKALQRVVVAFGGRLPAKKLGLEHEGRGPQCCTCHLGGGGL